MNNLSRIGQDAFINEVRSTLAIQTLKILSNVLSFNIIVMKEVKML